MTFILNGTTGIATVDGSVSAPSQRGQDSNSGISYAADTIKFSTGGVERMSITNSGVTGVGGITYADSWRVNTEFTASAGSNNVTANWERDDSDFQLIGTGLSHNGSGIFGFQETGKYLFMNRFVAYQSSSRRYVGTKLLISSSGIGGSYTTVTESFDAVSASGSNSFATGGTTKVIDATSTNFYFKIQTTVIDTTVFDCSSTQNRFNFIVIRLGDT